MFPRKLEFRLPTSLVDATVQLNDDLAGAVIIDLLELANVAVLLHDVQELDDDLGGRTDEDLALAGLLGIVDGVQAIIEDGGLDHCGGCGVVAIVKKNRVLGANLSVP